MNQTNTQSDNNVSTVLVSRLIAKSTSVVIYRNCMIVELQ